MKFMIHSRGCIP